MALTRLRVPFTRVALAEDSRLPGYDDMQFQRNPMEPWPVPGQIGGSRESHSSEAAGRGGRRRTMVSGL